MFGGNTSREIALEGGAGIKRTAWLLAEAC